MYLEFYGLSEPPFSITPDPRYVFLSERHRDALAHLLYGIGKGGSGGFVQLTGEVGTGKTTLCRLLLEQLPENTRVALVLNPKLSPVELLETICEELKLDIAGKRGSLKALTDTLNAYLLDAYAQGLRVVLIVDEAQNLSTDSLEQVRLLTNLETPTQKLLQIILLGQPELRDVLGAPGTAPARPAHHRALSPDAARRGRNRSLCAPSARGRGLLAHSVLAARPEGAVPALGRRAAPDQHHRRPRADGGLCARAGFDRRAHGRSRGRRNLAGPRALLAAPLRTLGRGGRARARDRRRVHRLARAAHDAPAAALPPPRRKPPAPAGRRDVAQHRTSASHRRRQQLDAFSQLLARWQVDPDSVSVRDASHCPAVIATGINCLRGRATLEQLARFDRPLILVLHHGEHQAHALLQGVGPAHVRLDLGSQRYELARPALSKFWTGEFIAVWRLPAEVPAASLKRGDAGAGVAWVKNRLAALDGGHGRVGAGLFRCGAGGARAQAADRLRHQGRWYRRPGDAVRAVRARRFGPHLARTVQ